MHLPIVLLFWETNFPTVFLNNQLNRDLTSAGFYLDEGCIILHLLHAVKTSW